MSSYGTIYYSCPDSAAPSGGVRRIYRHVEILNKHDFSAFVLHSSPTFKIGWFESNAPVRFRSESFYFAESDIVVIPEVMTKFMRESRSSGVFRIAMALNWAFIFGSLPIGDDWRAYGISHALAGSQFEHDFILKTMGIDAPVMQAGIDCDLFSPNEHKYLQIAFMPLKRSMAHEVLGVFRSIYGEHSDVALVSLENRTHSEVAEVLAKSAIFLSATSPQGIGRPTLEAMASGCLVVGFTGRGSAECMIHLDNCYVAEDGDLLKSAEYLDEAVKQFRSGRAGKMQEAARATALRYNLENEEQAVLRYWRRLLASR